MPPRPPTRRRELTIWSLPLGWWLECLLCGSLLVQLYFTVTLANDHLFTGRSLHEIRCPRGFSARLTDTPFQISVCRANVAVVLKASAGLLNSLLVAGCSGLALVFVRRARDAGVKLTLTRPPRSGPAEGWAGVQHLPLQWWLEPVLIAHVVVALYAALLIVRKAALHGARGYPSCEDEGWQWLLEIHEPTGAKSCTPALAVMGACALGVFNAVLAAGLNGLGLMLVREERRAEAR